jgi:UDP-N-acetylglucosamine acyltransferase
MPTTSTIHPTAVIGPGVELGTGVQVGPYAVLTGPLVVGDRVWIGAGALLGAPPEVTSARMNLAWAGDLEHEGVVIEADVVVREAVIVHQGTRRPTTVGAGSWLLNRAYLAHDVVLGAGVVVSAGVSIGGHATIGARANLGMNAAVHQRRAVGPGAMVGMSTPVSRDVPPFGLVHGNPPRLHGVNTFALRRDGFAPDVGDRLLAAYRDTADYLVAADGELAALADELGWWAALSDRRPMRLALGPVGA